MAFNRSRQFVMSLWAMLIRTSAKFAFGEKNVGCYEETNEYALATGYFPIWQANAIMSPAIQFAAKRPGQNIVRPCSWCSFKADRVVLLALMHTWSPC